MRNDRSLRQFIKWAAIYIALGLGMLWLHDPFDVSMNAAESSVKFVYQQF